MSALAVTGIMFLLAAQLDAGTVSDGGAAVEPQVVVSAQLEPTEVKLGQPFELVIELQRPTGVTFELPPQIHGPDVELLAVTRMTLVANPCARINRMRFGPSSTGMLRSTNATSNAFPFRFCSCGTASTPVIA